MYACSKKSFKPHPPFSGIAPKPAQRHPISISTEGIEDNIFSVYGREIQSRSVICGRLKIFGASAELIVEAHKADVERGINGGW